MHVGRRDVDSTPPRASTCRRIAVHVGLVFQDYALFPHLTALGNVMVALGASAAGRAARPRRGAAGAACTSPGVATGGRRSSRAASANASRWRERSRAIRQVLLLDEPFAAVDRALRRHLQDEIDELRRSLDIPVVLVTHDFDDVVRLATHLLLLDAGPRGGQWAAARAREPGRSALAARGRWGSAA